MFLQFHDSRDSRRDKAGFGDEGDILVLSMGTCLKRRSQRHFACADCLAKVLLLPVKVTFFMLLLIAASRYFTGEVSLRTMFRPAP